MPSLGADMTEGTLVEWLVRPGDVVHRGDVVAVVDTVKSAIDVEVFEEGRVDELLVQPGTSVPVGTPLALLSPTRPAAAPVEAAPVEAAPVEAAVEEPAHAVPEPAQVGRPKAPSATPVVRHLAHERGVDLAGVVGTGPDGAVTRADVEQASTFVRHPAAAAPVTARVEASPFARRRAAELGVDLAGVNGSGPGGAITVADVEASAAPTSTSAPPPAPQHRAARRKKADVAAVPAAGAPGAAGDAAERAAAMRTAIGQLMARSKREIPHYYLQTTVDLSALTDWLERRNAGRPVADRLLPVAALLKASALAARAVPEVNGFFLDGAFRRADHVHLGVAVSLRGGGLVAPAIHDADLLGLEELMAALKDLVARARAGRLRGSEMSDPTLTVTNLGDQGAELVHGVIYPPQVALVGLGRVVERPWAVDRMLTVRPVVTATLAADHRVTDGHRGGLYLAALGAALQKPEEL